MQAIFWTWNRRSSTTSMFSAQNQVKLTKPLDSLSLIASKANVSDSSAAKSHFSCRILFSLYGDWLSDPAAFQFYCNGFQKCTDSELQEQWTIVISSSDQKRSLLSFTTGEFLLHLKSSSTSGNFLFPCCNYPWFHHQILLICCLDNTSLHMAPLLRQGTCHTSFSCGWITCQAFDEIENQLS